MLTQPDHIGSATSTAGVRLFRYWLQRCDEHHDCSSSPKPKKGFLPTRLLNVNPSHDMGQVRLDAASVIDGNRYLALSHCWGQSTTGKAPEWLTLTGNVAARMEGFELDDLPATFQDAVQVTRELGIPYLWIESICIVQDDDHDWNRESKRMEDVYSSAYCTIAATSATNSDTGFLGGIGANDNFFIQDDSGIVAYVSTNVADFDHDVNEASLNQRAWVMQERFLSPRTIHFTDTQMYGKCGNGVYAGDGIYLRSRRGTRRFFQIDLKFLNRLRSSGFATTWEFLRSLLEDYTQRGITEPLDRAVAISGLMARIKKALPCPVHHGIIDWSLHRALLWKRVKGESSRKIRYLTAHVPSWSWMAYEGVVEFVPDEFGTLDRAGHLAFDKAALTTTIWEFVDPGMRIAFAESDGLPTQVYDSRGSPKGWVALDEDIDISSVQAVAVLAKRREARTEECKYYVLFVKYTKQHEWDQDEESPWEVGFERIGMGMLKGDCELQNIGEGRIL